MSAIDKKERMIAMAVAAALIAGLLGWLFLRHLETNFQDASETVSVLVANRYVPPGTPLSPAFFALATFPKAYLQPGAVMEYAVLESSPGHPRFRNDIPLLEGSQLTQTSLSALFAEHGLSQIIPDHRVAVSIGVNSVRGLNGLIRPGDLINILQTAKGAATLFQAVPVLAVGRKLAVREEPTGREGEKPVKDLSGDENHDDITVITVSLNPLAAVRLIQARESEPLSVVLRPLGDDRTVEGLP